MKNIYLDHAATSPLLPAVKDTMLEIIELESRGEFGNASALHGVGQRAHIIIEDARAEVAKLINADPSEIIFTSGGSESNNTVIHSFAGKNIAVSAIEHPSVLEPARAYAKKLEILPVDEWGNVKTSNLPETIDLLSVMLANNELGTIQPIKEIVKLAKESKVNIDKVNSKDKCCKNYNTYVHSDATQALGKIPIDVEKLDVDYLTVSAHKIGGPQGIGALYIRGGAPFTPLILGGHQEQKRRAGTSNLLAIAGFGTAAKWCRENQSHRMWNEISKLRDQLKDLILEKVPHSSINSPSANCLPNILNVSFSAAEGESIQLYLDMAGVTVSTGSACAAGDIKPSHVLMATRNDAEVAHSSIRISLGLDTKASDLAKIVNALSETVTKLQGFSTIKIEE